MEGHTAENYGMLKRDLALELKEKSQATRKPRQAVVRKPKRKHCSESEAESESDDDEEEADDVEEEHAAAPEPARSINDRAGLYRVDVNTTGQMLDSCVVTQRIYLALQLLLLLREPMEGIKGCYIVL